MTTLKYFNDPGQVARYVVVAAIEALNDDLYRMQKEEYEIYDDEDRDVMADKIADLEMYADALAHSLDCMEDVEESS